MTFGIEGTTSATYDLTGKSGEYSTGVQLTNGNTNGKSAFVHKLAAGVAYTNLFGQGATASSGRTTANARIKLGGEIPFARKGCHNWYIKNGVIIYAEVKANADLVETKNTNTVKDGLHQYRLDGGGGVELTFRDGNFDLGVGVKAGYVNENVFSLDKELRANCNAGQAYCAPTFRVEGFFPNTQLNTDVLGGLGIGLEAQFDVLNKQLEGSVKIIYNF